MTAIGQRRPAARSVPAGRRRTRPVWQGEPRRTTSAAKAVVLTLAVLAVVVPFWAVVATSLSPDAQVIRDGGWSLWPERISFHAYQQIMSGGQVSRAMTVSAGVTLRLGRRRPAVPLARRRPDREGARCSVRRRQQVMLRSLTCCPNAGFPPRLSPRRESGVLQLVMPSSA